MTINLTPDQEEWLQAHVARGVFPSIGEAVRVLIDEQIAQHLVDDGDLVWAKPHVEAALAEAQRGEVLSMAEHEARISALLP